MKREAERGQDMVEATRGEKSAGRNGGKRRTLRERRRGRGEEDRVAEEGKKGEERRRSTQAVGLGSVGD